MNTSKYLLQEATNGSEELFLHVVVWKHYFSERPRCAGAVKGWGTENKEQNPMGGSICKISLH